MCTVFAANTFLPTLCLHALKHCSSGMTAPSHLSLHFQVFHRVKIPPRPLSLCHLPQRIDVHSMAACTTLSAAHLASTGRSKLMTKSTVGMSKPRLATSVASSSGTASLLKEAKAAWRCRCGLPAQETCRVGCTRHARRDFFHYPRYTGDFMVPFHACKLWGKAVPVDLEQRMTRNTFLH